MEIDNKALETAMAVLNKQFGAGSLIRLGDKEVQPWKSIPTGAVTLDRILGNSGFPRGRIVEIFGRESAGKSTLALTVVAEAQKQGLACLYLDMEHALDPTYMAALGVDPDELILSQPQTGEDAIDIAAGIIKSGGVGVVVVDSVPALVTKVELEGQVRDKHMGQTAALMSMAMKHITGVADETETLVIFINQVRDNLSGYGKKENTPGGWALKFQSSIRLEIRKIENIVSKNGEILGIKSQITIQKNKMAAALRKCEIDIIYGHGIDKIASVADASIEAGLIKKSGAWFAYDDQSFQGRANLIEYLEENPEVAELLRKKVLGDE